MSALDRAFMKAYCDAPAVGVAKKPAPIVATLAPESPEPVAIAQPAYIPREPSPSVAIKTAAAPATAPTIEKKLAARPLSMPLRRATGNVAPLSTFTPPPRSVEPAAAATTVESLDWPKACIDLLACAHRGWQAFAERIIERRAQGERCVAIASCAAGEGRTTIVLATAKCLAARGMRVAVVDASFDNPALAKCFGLAPLSGWSDVVNGEQTLAEASIAAESGRVTLVPWRGPAARAARPGNEARAAALFKDLKAQHDLVLIDAMPLGARAVAEFVELTTMMSVDVIYFVRDARVTGSEQIGAECQRLAKVGLPVAGIIENFAPVGSASVEHGRDTSVATASRVRQARAAGPN
jgi:Mrp family chromosome partitioning ATPase